MTVTTTHFRKVYDGDGSTGAFTISFQFWDVAEIDVKNVIATTGVVTQQILTTHYSVTGGNGSTGLVTFVTAPPSGTEVHIERQSVSTQNVDLSPSQKLPSASIEQAIDRQAMRYQEMSTSLERYLSIPATDKDTDFGFPSTELPNKIDRASKVLAFDSAGVPIASTQADQSLLTVVATGSVTARTHAERWGEVRNVKDYGAVGNGIADDTSACQAAINAAELIGGGVIYFPIGIYKITSTLNISLPVFLRGEVMGEANSNTNGGTQLPYIRWHGDDWNGTNAGIAGTEMVYFKAAVSSEYLIGGGVSDLMFDANPYASSHSAGASVAIRLSSTRDQKFSRLALRKCGFAGMLIDSANVVLQGKCVFESIWYVWGSKTTNSEASSHGVYIGGGNLVDATDGHLTTQNDFTSIFGLVYDGYMVRLEGTDNNHFGSVQGIVQSGGSGGSVYLGNAGTASPARQNIFGYVHKHVYAESETHGNTIDCFVAEGSRIALAAGAQINYQVLDYVDGAHFSTHQYIMSDILSIPASAFGNGYSQAATAGASALQWPCFDFPTGLSRSIGVSMPGPSTWNDGEITGCKFFISTDVVPGASDACLFRISSMSQSNTGEITTPPVVDDVLVDLIDNDHKLQAVEITFTPAISYSVGDWIGVRVNRVGSDGSDDFADDVKFLGMELVYTATGPSDFSQGPFDVGPWEHA